MKKLTLIAVLMIIALPVLALAQEESETAEETPLMERIQKATELIKASKEAREAGIPAEEVKEVLEGARDRGLSPGETEEVLTESTAAVQESGPVDNFGSFVGTKLDEGLRGKELANAIHEEHRLRGKGKGQGQGKGQAQQKMKKKEQKNQQQNQEGEHRKGDNGDSDDENKDRDKSEDQGKGGKKGKGK